MRTILTLAVTSALLLTIGCEGRQLIVDNRSPSQKQADERVVLPITSARGGYSTQNDPFEIHDARVDGDLLAIKVSYIGGKELHDFRMIQMTGLLESQPPQADLLLFHKGRDDPGTDTIEHELLFNLATFKENLAEPNASNGLGDTVLLRIRKGNGIHVHLPLPKYVMK